MNDQVMNLYFFHYELEYIVFQRIGEINIK